jgi:hypothetical protein
MARARRGQRADRHSPNPRRRKSGRAGALQWGQTLNPLLEPMGLFTIIGLAAGFAVGPALIWAAIDPPQGHAWPPAFVLIGAIWTAFLLELVR